MKTFTITLILILFAACAAIPKEPVNEYLVKGNWEEGMAALATHPREGEFAFEYGLLLSFRAVELLYQDLDRYGAGRTSRGEEWTQGPFPWSTHREPEPIKYDAFAGIFRRLRDRLLEASAVLERGGSGDWKSKVFLAKVKLDLNGDGQRTDLESLGAVFVFLTRLDNDTAKEADHFSLAFDAADSLWLAGYTRLVEGILNLILAYDLRPLWQAYGYNLFPNVTDSKPDSFDFSTKGLMVSDRSSGERARQAFLEVSRLSPRSWQMVQAETDDDHEWLAGPNQTPPFPINITEERIRNWVGFMQDWEKLLKGSALLPGGILNSRYSQQGFSLMAFLQNLPDLRSDLMDSVMENYLKPIRSGTEIIDRSGNFFDYLTGGDDPIFALYAN